LKTTKRRSEPSAFFGEICVSRLLQPALFSRVNSQQAEDRAGNPRYPDAHAQLLFARACEITRHIILNTNETTALFSDKTEPTMKAALIFSNQSARRFFSNQSKRRFSIRVSSPQISIFSAFVHFPELLLPLRQAQSAALAGSARIIARRRLSAPGEMRYSSNVVCGGVSSKQQP
jgi:hypothetical protein